MTLAVILSLMICCPTSALPLVPAGPQNAPQAAPASKADETPATPDQGTAAAAQNPPTPPQPPSSAKPPAQTASGQTRPAPAKKPRHKKKATTSPNCVSAPATGQPATGSTPATDPVPADGAPNPGSATAPTNCPPSKVIVRQGGTSEPSVQLAGGPAGQTSHQRDTANQMLGTTEANLKKIAGRQLSSNEQDMVNQTRQFMAQSKAAFDAGDLERARTLAWKAQLLSEELVKPEK
ncbi:MAG: hypothetical protein WA830_04300 [Candidatus Sulfotelmatobacter sp.]